jgi:hypothetical protein
MATLGAHRASLTADYDRTADVLYLTLQPALPDEGEDAPRGVVLRFSMDNNKPTGVTVVGLVHNHWDIQIDCLSKIIADHLMTPQNYVKDAIKTAIGERFR